jgi:outer membrane protein assembly factor BamB
VANLPGGPAVVVGDEAGNVYAYRLATGAAVWTYKAGAPVNSTPSVAALTA